MDGELMPNGTYQMFDLLELEGKDLRELSCASRVHMRFAVAAGSPVAWIPSYFTSFGKRALFNQIKRDRLEGLAFKRKDSHVVPGRPGSGGDQLKYKFTDMATCQVLGQNGKKRSVQLGTIGANGEIENVGNCTIPANQSIPPTGSLIEVRYLYAYKGGSLFQPRCLGVRDDKDVADRTDSLKFKPEGFDEDDES